MTQERYVTVVGGANVDLVGSPSGELIGGESNPGTVSLSSGGVGRNIAENLSRLGVATRLLTVLGDDPHGGRILADCRRSGIDMTQVAVADGETSCYLAILDASGELGLAVSQMDLIESIDAAFLDARAPAIRGASLVVVDANLSRAALEHLLGGFSAATFFVDTVSAAKAERLRDLIHHAHTIKPNRAEAEVLSGIAIGDRSDLEKALRHFLRLGVERVFISLGEGGLFFGDDRGSGRLPAPRARVANATGSGDAATAALVYAYLQGMTVEESAGFALAASLLALSDPRTTHPEMSVAAVEAMMRELKPC